MWDQYQFHPRLLASKCLCVCEIKRIHAHSKYYYYYGKRIPIFHHLNKHAIVRAWYRSMHAIRTMYLKSICVTFGVLQHKTAHKHVPNVITTTEMNSNRVFMLCAVVRFDFCALVANTPMFDRECQCLALSAHCTTAHWEKVNQISKPDWIDYWQRQYGTLYPIELSAFRHSICKICRIPLPFGPPPFFDQTVFSNFQMDVRR